MGFLDWLKRKFSKKKPEEFPETKRFKALEQPIEALESRFRALEALQALESVPKPLPEEGIQEKRKIEVEKDSLKLGLAAGFAAKSLREIENSLSRIESLMPTRDWIENRILSELQVIKDKIFSHDKSSLERFRALESALKRLNRLSETLPLPIKKEFKEELRKIEESLPLTPKMKELLEIIREKGEISYEDLAKELGISLSALRGLLTLTLRRTKQIERLKKKGKGWVRFVPYSSSLSESDA